ncbi:MAG: hypothetical protein AB1489_36075 [Acidobacteriota bacterium]
MSITFLEAFNAKQMRTSEVAATFVPTTHFHHLAGAWNALLIGPRGSGKTTYLRMLELRALRAWQHAEADKYREGITYTGIFVPADIAWGAMVQALGGGRLRDDCFDVVAHAAFATNVLQATVNAMEDRVRTSSDLPYGEYRVSALSGSELEQVIADIAEAWRVPIKTLSFSGLRTALGCRLLDLKAKALEVSAKEDHSLSDVYQKIEYSTLDLNDALTIALSRLDEVINDRDGKWGLLLDEFEIAPESLQNQILANLRSSNTKLIYKIALVPCGPHTNASLATLAPPSGGNDYRQIELWHRDKNSTMNFCAQVFSARMGQFTPFSNKSPDEVFGKSQHADSDNELIVGKEWSSRWAGEFIQLAQKDETFRDYLVNKGIDVSNLDSSVSRIRKIAPLVAFRNAHQRSNAARKGRKKLLFAYSGWDAIAAISEGNPRWLIGMLNMIVSRLRADSRLPVAQSIQYDQVEAAAEEFAAMLHTAATEHSVGICTSKSVFELLSEIGTYFNKRLVEAPFIEEPPLSFEVDDRVDDDTENALRIAFNHGAVVCLSESDEMGGYRSLKGKRFRLAYLLAPKFSLPLRSTKYLALSSILAGHQLANTSKMEAIKNQSPQESLF